MSSNLLIGPDPREFGCPTTIYNCLQRWTRLGVFKKAIEELAVAEPDNKYAMIDSSFSKANRIACSGNIEKGHDRLIGLTKGGWNTKFSLLIDEHGRPVFIELSEGQEHNIKSAERMIEHMPPAEKLIADKAYDSEKFIKKLAKETGIKACIPTRNPPKSGVTV